MTIVSAKRARVSRASIDATAVSAGRAARYLATAATVAAAVTLAVCIAPTSSRAQSPEATPSATEAPSASEFIGKTTKQVKDKLGPPTTTEYLQETGGWLLIYARPDAPHYVFETGPDGVVKRASVTR